MKSNFGKLNFDKRNVIINSGFKEFSMYDFKKSSINTIVEDAGISKGVFYHYFSGKRSFYDYLCSYAIEYVFNEVNRIDILKETDFIKRIKSVAIVKISIIQTYRYIFSFLIKIYEDKSLKEIKDSYGEEYFETQYKIYNDNLDLSVFRKDIKISTIIKMITRIVDKISEENLTKLRTENETYENIIQSFNEELIVIEKLFYQ